MNKDFKIIKEDGRYKVVHTLSHRTTIGYKHRYDAEFIMNWATQIDFNPKLFPLAENESST